MMRVCRKSRRVAVACLLLGPLFGQLFGLLISQPGQAAAATPPQAKKGDGPPQADAAGPAAAKPNSPAAPEARPASKTPPAATSRSAAITEPRKGPDTPPRITRTERLIEGWRIQIDDRLAAPEHADLLKKAGRLLADRLYEIAEFLPAERTADLRKVVILVDLDHGRLTSMQYHPSEEWLRENGYDPAMARCVHVPSVQRMVDVHHQRVQPWCVLHELAHAYHDQVLDFDNAEVKAAYEASKASGGYAKALHIQGHETKHYAMTNPMEYFAELSECYIGTNDFYPFVRGELKQHDPRAYALMEKIWGKLP